jgi:hypothetical protein
MTLLQLSSLQGFHRTPTWLRSDVSVCYSTVVLNVVLHTWICLLSSFLPFPALYYHVPLRSIIPSYSILSILLLYHALLPFLYCLLSCPLILLSYSSSTADPFSPIVSFSLSTLCSPLFPHSSRHSSLFTVTRNRRVRAHGMP